MDVRIALFIHVLTVATWFGCISLMAMYMREAIRSKSIENMHQAIRQTHRWNLSMIVPTSVLALITGIYMLIKSYSGIDATWLLVKERFGSLVILAFILLVTFYGRKLVKAAQSTDNLEQAQKPLKTYILILNLTLLCMVILMAFVTIKIDF